MTVVIKEVVSEMRSDGTAEVPSAAKGASSATASEGDDEALVRRVAERVVAHFEREWRR